jgi:hypothetical protein
MCSNEPDEHDAEPAIDFHDQPELIPGYVKAHTVPGEMVGRAEGLFDLDRRFLSPTL